MEISQPLLQHNLTNRDPILAVYRPGSKDTQKERLVLMIAPLQQILGVDRSNSGTSLAGGQCSIAPPPVAPSGHRRAWEIRDQRSSISRGHRSLLLLSPFHLYCPFSASYYFRHFCVSKLQAYSPTSFLSLFLLLYYHYLYSITTIPTDRSRTTYLSQVIKQTLRSLLTNKFLTIIPTSYLRNHNGLSNLLISYLRRKNQINTPARAIRL